MRKITKDILLEYNFTYNEICYEIAFYTPGDKILRTFRVMEVNKGWWFIIDWSTGDGTRSGLNLGVYHYVHELKRMHLALTGKKITGSK